MVGAVVADGGGGPGGGGGTTEGGEGIVAGTAVAGVGVAGGCGDGVRVRRGRGQSLRAGWSRSEDSLSVFSDPCSALWGRVSES